MRKFLILLLFYTVSELVYGQIVKGVILDSKTNSKISYASVYFNGTFGGAIADLNGYFELNISKYYSSPIIVSAIGDYSKTIANYTVGKPLTIKLEPKLYKLDEVLIKTKTKVWKRRANLKTFKEQFLGTSSNASKCNIVNEDDILFTTKGDTLKAFALKPILVVNKALGYIFFITWMRFGIAPPTIRSILKGI